MDRLLKNANEITSNTTTKWTVLVQVFERRNAKKNEAGINYRNYMVTDMMGTKVPIVMFGGSVACFANSLMPFKRYYISNAIVSLTDPQYRVVDYAYTWTLRPRHLVEPHDELIPPALPCTFAFDRFSDLYHFADQTRPICIKALVIHAFPAQDTDELSSARDFVVINEEGIAMLLRVWDDLMIETDVNVHARYKIPTLIIAYGLKVTTHHGFSLGTRTSAYILHNPPLNEERPLKDWYAANSARVTSLLETRAYRDTSKLFHPPNADEIIPLITAIPRIENVKTLWTRGKLTCTPGQERMWFESCAKCYRAVDADVDWTIWCSTCQERTKVTVRGFINVFLSHEFTFIETTIKSPDTDKLLPFSAADLRIAAEKNAPLRKEVEAALEGVEVFCFLKYFERPSKGGLARHCSILRVYTEAQIQSYHEAVERGHNNPALEAPTLSALTAIEDISSSSSAPATPADKEFLAIPANKVSEELPLVKTNEQVQSGTAPSVKRMLAFEETEGKKVTRTSTTETIGSSTATNNTPPAELLPKEPTTLSTSKKLKTKNQNA